MSQSQKIVLQPRSIVVPGELLAEGEFQIPWSPYILKINSKYYSTVVGLFDVKDTQFEVIPLEGSFYYPKINDIVIGLVEDVEIYGWVVDIKAPYKAYLPASNLLGRSINVGEDLRRYLDVGDYVIARIENFDRSIDPVLSVKGKDLGRVSNGIVIDIMPVKVPRVIGKNKSMYETLTSKSGCSIFVANNGRIWATCPSRFSEEILIEAIRKIENESHIKGLTDRIKQFIEEKLGERNASSGETKTNS
ncbi:RNA-binding protein [Saccharolobus solfataricus]|nr:exosome complex RNA-binding protein Rrp4 [Saccharolobus solfataricus]AKA75085.1 RNA-binding protein [Saccharolobus solfataricus]AKA76756.1 RNA-binding protein [Saccharolobus solfataricus]AKA80471.1 RNA-binding protein [Saccharolobus solfataricus]AZF69531.1 RNA-binding protein [Saccharolobus solfataricus]AZF72151.1 RNA-binding protein [Saccharolobus solfataricus]